MTNNHASFRLRYLALATDFSIFFFPMALGMYYIASQQTLPLAVSALFLLLILIVFNPFFMYQHVIFTHYFQGTIGKLLAGLRVTAENGEKLSFKRIAFRQTVGYSFSSLIFGLGYWSMIKDPNKQTWHDKAVGSVVVVKQKLWPLALLTIIVFTVLNIIFARAAIRTLTAGPLLKETQVILNNMHQEMEQNRKQQPRFNPSINPGHNAPQTPARVT